MPEIHRVISLDVPPLHPYRTLRRPKEHLDNGIFVAEGEKVVLRLLASDLPITSLLVSDQWLELVTASVPQERLPKNIYVADKTLLNTIVGFRMHQGIMAVAKVPPEPDLDELVQRSAHPYLFAAIDGLVFAENVGVVVRNCAAFGVQGLLVGETSASPYLRRAVRNSMGTVFQLPIIHAASLSGTLHSLASNHGIFVLVADAHAESSLYQFNCRKDLCVVFGNEDAGVSDATNKAAPVALRIPMKERVDSLNVASASAAMLAEISRQRFAL